MRPLRALRFGLACLLPTLAFACAKAPSSDPTPPGEPRKAIEPEVATPAANAADEGEPVAIAPIEEPAHVDAKTAYRAWMTARLPAGGKLSDDGSVVHVTGDGESFASIAHAYFSLSDAWSERELAVTLERANGKLPKHLTPGLEVVVPGMPHGIPSSPTDARLGWPEDKSLRGIYVNATMLQSADFPRSLDQMAERGLNAIVVDAKDVTGWFTYPSKIPLALETNSNKYATISSLERLVRVAHGKGIRVLARVACFRDEHLGPTRPDLAIQSKHGGAHRGPGKTIDWMDPRNETVQSYLLSVVHEVIDAGVDEVQLDYVRFPTEGIWDADFHLPEGTTTEDVITAFVGRVHDVTKDAGVPLSLDVFGCVAWANKPDMDSTGQDLRRLGTEVEALSPMVYPSHFGDGFNGYEIPGDHPDIVAIGTQHAVDTLAKVGITNVVIRSWVQAFPYKSPHFGSGYIADQIKEAKNGGGVGWLAWNSGGEYGATFAAVPILKKGPVLAKK